MKHRIPSLLLAGMLACTSPIALAACGSTASTNSPQVIDTIPEPEPGPNLGATDVQAPYFDVPANGTYSIEVTTDSSMFRSESCELTATDGRYTAELTLPGEGFSKLYFGKADQAASAPKEEIYEYHLNDEGKYVFSIPVSTLELELPIAAYGQRRDTWYDHTIVFHAPASDAKPANQTE